MFPCYFYEEGTELPDSGTYFVVAGNGNWLHKDTGIVKAFLPVEHISVLKDLDAKTWVSCDLPKLPAKFVCQIKCFFQMVTDRYRTEANVILYYNKQDQSYKIVVPQQRVTGVSVDYRREGSIHDPEMADYLRVGTIHSHCDFGAFHSGTDRGDETDFDGLHCTFGDNHKENFTIVASVVVNGHRLSVDPTTVLEGVELVGSTYRLQSTEVDMTEVQEWFQRVQAAWFFRPSVGKGDKVVWAGDLKTVPFRTVCGEGPFLVDSVGDGFYTIITNVGLARFSEKLFKKAQE